MALPSVRCVDCNKVTAATCPRCGRPYCGCESDTDETADERVCEDCQGELDDEDEDGDEDDEGTDFGDDGEDDFSDLDDEYDDDDGRPY